jgi:hypothetical protein
VEKDCGSGKGPQWSVLTGQKKKKKKIFLNTVRPTDGIGSYDPPLKYFLSYSVYNLII